MTDRQRLSWELRKMKELINNDVFPGGMLSTHFVVPFFFDEGEGAGPEPVTIPRGSCYDSNNGRGC